MPRSKTLGALALAFTVAACNAPGAAPAPVFIRGSQGRFDPKVSTGPEVAGLRTERVGPTAPFIVQFRGHVTLAERASLKRAGATVVAYQPDDALLVRVAPSAVKTLRQLSGVRAVVAQSPALRIQPSLLGRADGRLVPSTSMKPVALFIEVSGEDAQVAVAQAVRSMGGTVEQAATTGRNLTVRLPEAAATELAARSDVVWVQKANHFHLLNDQARWVIQAGIGSANVGKTPVWDKGITGKGQIIGIADSGVDTQSCFFSGTSNKVQYYTFSGALQGDESPGHGTHTSGSLAGNTSDTANSQYDGQAKDAQLYFEDIGGLDSQGQGALTATVLNGDITSIFSKAYTAGARIHSDSWGGQTADYDAQSAEIDAFVASNPEMLIVVANGNAGPGAGTVGTPATAKNIISVGATSSATAANPTAPDGMAYVVDPTTGKNIYFSSLGPTTDGRLKPTLTAPGQDLQSADYQQACGVQKMSGTSMATPTLAGGATLAREYFTDGFYPSGSKTAANAMTPSAALLKAVLIAGADTMAGDQAGGLLSEAQGFGRVDLDHALYFTGDHARDRLWVHDASTGINTGDAPTFTLTTDRAGPLRIALTWSDAAAAAGADPALVNDLDLEVTGPDGMVYAGNALRSGQSVGNGLPDQTNVEEVFYLAGAAAGTWTIAVTGANVPQGPQTFALAAVGEVKVQGQGAPSSDPSGPPPPPPPAPLPGACTDDSASPVQSAVGWVDAGASQNYFGDDDIYASNMADPQGGFGDRYGVIQVPVTVQAGQTLDHLSLTVTCQTAAWSQPGTTWTFEAIDLPQLASSTTYSDIQGATVLATSPDTVDDTMVARGQANTVTFPATAVASNGYLTVRIHATGAAAAMVSWDSGYPTTTSSNDTTPGLGIPPVVGQCWQSTTPPPPPPPPTALKLNAIGDQTDTEGLLLDLVPTLASDPQLATPVFTATGLPTGANLDGATGELTWTPTFGQAGTYPVTLTVAEGTASDSQSFNLIIQDANRAPAFTPVADQTVQVGHTLTFAVSAPDPDGDAVQIVVTNGPSAATFDGSTFTWTPTTADVGTVTVSFKATDIDGDTAAMDVQVTVTQGSTGGADGGRPSNAPDAPNCACSATQGSPTGLLPLAFGLLGLAALRRRRRI